MKLAELILEHGLAYKAEAALKTLDWAFDVDPFQSKRFDHGTKAMNEAEELLGALYKKSPDAAQELWEKYCPYAHKGSLPATVLRYK